MRYLIILLINIICSNGIAQVNNEQLNFSAINYKLTDKRIDIDTYELYLKSMLAFGDKSIIQEEVFKSMLSGKSFEFQDSLIQLWLIEILPDSSKILKLPKISSDWRDFPLFIFEYTILSEAYRTNTSYVKNYIEIIDKKEEFFPHLPSRESSVYNDPILVKFNSFIEYINWASNYPKEVDYFLNILIRNAKKVFKDKSEDKLIKKYTAFIDSTIFSSVNIEREYVPKSIQDYLHYYSLLKKKQIMFADLCNKEHIDQFIEQAYFLIFEQKISYELFEELRDFIVSNNLFDPEMIYYSLLISKYE